jgi:hypothetical protein
MAFSAYATPLALVLATATAGCRSVDIPSAVVIPAVTAPQASETAWLESATVICRSDAAPIAPPTNGLATASYSPGAASDATPVAATTLTPPAVLRVLAIRYPHPDGRRDVARAELVVADAAAAPPSGSSVRKWFGQTLDGVLPGVAWGPGIRRAVGLDIPASELRGLIAAAQQAPVAGQATGQAPPIAKLDVNGQSITVASTTPPQLQQLMDRVARDGRVISYHGSAADLAAASVAAAPAL